MDFVLAFQKTFSKWNSRPEFLKEAQGAKKKGGPHHCRSGRTHDPQIHMGWMPFPLCFGHVGRNVIACKGTGIRDLAISQWDAWVGIDFR